MLGERSMPSSSFLHLAGWNVDVMSGAHVAILDFEAECVDIVEQQREGSQFLMTGEPILCYFAGLQISFS